MGDKSDNIISVFDKCGKKTVEKCYNDTEFFSDKLKKENRTDRFELNKKLISFDLIPQELVDLYYTSILINL